MEGTSDDPISPDYVTELEKKTPSGVTGPGPSDAVGPKPLIEFDGVSKWYGNVIGVNNLTFHIGPGITGLLGPNGAGKSTLLQLATGQLRPSKGSVKVLGYVPWNNPPLNRHLGLCPEQDAFYEWMTGYDFVWTCARLTGLSRADAKVATELAVTRVRMTNAQDRAIKGYSKGMRQRIKIAQALVHEPEVLFLDEPLTGTDPVARREIMDIIAEMGAQGKSIVVSSHVLHEVQAVTNQIVLLNRGRLVATGNIHAIRDLIDTHPHRILIHSPDPRALAAALVRHSDVRGIDFRTESEADKHTLLIETFKPDEFYARLPEIALTDGLRIDGVYSEDDNLDAVFKYLVSQ